MNLHEFQAKVLFRRHGIPVPDGELAESAEQAAAIAARYGGPVMVKAQVLTGGRGKAGGVKLAVDSVAAGDRAGDILGLDIRGQRVRRVLITPAAEIQHELYLGIILDRNLRRPVIMASRLGGIDIEAVAAEQPEAITRVPIEPLLGLQPQHIRRLAYGMGLDGALTADFAIIVRGLYNAYHDADATLAEINPLAVTTTGLVALDGKMTLDDNALDRQAELAAWRDPASETEAERQARESGLSFVALDGNIGCLVNGAGLAMATMDVIKLHGGEPANFLDIGGGAQADKVELAMRLILSDKRVEAVLVNIFGGITRGDEVARGIVAALGNIDTDVPFVTRIVGTNADAARAILAGARMRTASNLAEAAQLAVTAAREVAA